MCHYKSMRMKTSQACKYLGVARHTLYKMIEDGMPAHRSIGGHYMFDQEEMDQYIGKAPALPERMAVGYCRVSTKKTPWPSATCRNENGGIELNKGLSS